jgi:hypothetical protein
MTRSNPNKKIICECGKQYTLKNKARHCKSRRHIQWEDPSRVESKKLKQQKTKLDKAKLKQETKGFLFSCLWKRFMKYPLCKKIWRQHSEITGIAIGNEFDHKPRCQALIKTKEKMGFRAFKELLKTMRIRQPDSLKRCNNVRVSLRRITNWDKFAMVRGFPLSDTSTVYRAAKYASSNKIIDYNLPIANTIARHNRSLFEMAFKYYAELA